MHSWSLLRNKLPEPSTERIDMFHRICELASKEGRAWGFGEYLDHRATIEGKQRVTRLLPKRPRDDEPTPPPGTVTCNICDTVFKRESVIQDRCPSCSSSSRDRQARFVIDTYGLPLDWPVVGADPSNGSVPPSAVAVPGLDPVLGEASTVYLGVSGPEGGRRAGDHAWANPCVGGWPGPQLGAVDVAERARTTSEVLRDTGS